jgi:hypothetical protein
MRGTKRRLAVSVTILLSWTCWLVVRNQVVYGRTPQVAKTSVKKDLFGDITEGSAKDIEDIAGIAGTTGHAVALCPRHKDGVRSL